MAPVRQTNFRAGELSPFLWGRTDLPTFGSGVRTARNFIVTKTGALVSRPGTTFVVNLKYYQSPELGPDRDSGQVRLIPFSAGDGDYESYALELGNNYVRFVQGNAQVLNAGVPYELATPWASTELWELQYAQAGDVLVICHPNHDPYELRRSGHTDWEIRKVRFKAYAPFATDAGDPSTPTVGFTVVTAEEWQASHAYAEGELATNSGNLYECITAGNSAGSGGPSTEDDDITDGTAHWRFLSLKSQPDVEHVAREWQWMWTALVRDIETGLIYETLGEVVSEEFDGFDYDASAAPLISDQFPVYPDMPVRLRRSETGGLISPPDGYDTYVVEEYLVYRGRGGLFGFVGSTKSREFVDVGDPPDYTKQPPLGTEPFGTATEPSGAPAPFDTRRLDRPSAVAFFQQRLVFGGITRFKDDVFTSKTGDFQNWDARLYSNQAGQALHYRLACQKKEDIKSFTQLGRFLFAFTGASPWNIGGAAGAPLDWNSVDMRPVDQVGSRSVPPLVVDGSVLFVRSKGRGVRVLVPNGRTDENPFDGADVSQLAHHLFTGKSKGIVDWTYAEDPFGTVWAVREDGQLLSLTFTKDGAGWAHHDTDGLVESICAIPEGEEDAIYVVVQRESGNGKYRCIERMTSRVIRGGLEVNDAGTAVTVPPDDICLDSALQYFGPPTQFLSGLGHLRGKEIWVLAEGREPLGPYTVDITGEIDLGEELEANVETVLGDKLVLYAGLAFTCDIETLDIATGEARMRPKAVVSVGIELDASRGAAIGTDFDHLEEGELRTIDDGYQPVSNATEMLTATPGEAWNLSGRVVMRQARPVPVTVVGITRELDSGPAT